MTVLQSALPLCSRQTTPVLPAKVEQMIKNRHLCLQGPRAPSSGGNGTNVIKIAPETAIKLTCNDRLKRMVCKDVEEITPLQRMLSGALAGAVAQVREDPLLPEGILVTKELLLPPVAPPVKAIAASLCQCSNARIKRMVCKDVGKITTSQRTRSGALAGVVAQDMIGTLEDPAKSSWARRNAI